VDYCEGRCVNLLRLGLIIGVGLILAYIRG
jgi:hypothetical protein